MKKFLLIVLIAVFAISAFSANYVVKDMFAKEKPNTGGVLYLALKTAPQSFNQYGTLDNSAYTILGNMLTALMEMNPITNEIEPALAESWDFVNGGKEVVFHLRDVKWSDGVQFTADDVIFSMNYFVMNKYAEGNEVSRFTVGGELVKWVKVDRMTVKAILPKSFGAFFTVTSHAKILPKHLLENKIDKSDLGSVNKIWTTDVNPSEMAGTGPYVVEKYDVDQKVTLKRNKNYWKEDKWGNQLPYLDKLVYLIIKDPQVAMAKFISGEIDYMDVTSNDFPVLKQKELNGSPFIVYRAQPTKPVPSPMHITFNFDAKDKDLAEVFRNVNFRRAMEYALDRERIIDEVYNTLAVKGGVPVLPTNKAFYNPKIEEIRRGFDLDKAADMLNSLGIKDRNRDGIRELKNGKKLEFVLLTNSNQEFQDVAYLYSRDLESIGVKLSLQIVDPSLMGQKALAGNYEACLWAFGNQPDPQLRKAIWQPGNPLYYNHLSTMNREMRTPIKENMYDWELRVWEDFEKGQEVMEPEKRKEYYGDWQEVYAEYVPFIYVCKGMNLIAANKSLGNFYQKPDGIIVYSVDTIFKK